MVDNQHRKISGYRDLTEDEIALMNRVKQQEREMLAGIDLIAALPAVDLRSLALARTNIQQGFMWMVRAIARPE
jgi:hypothetical protein